MEWDAVEHLFDEDIVGDDWGDLLFDNGSSANEQPVAQPEPQTDTQDGWSILQPSTMLRRS
jgi:hypothetical protein